MEQTVVVCPGCGVTVIDPLPVLPAAYRCPRCKGSYSAREWDLPPPTAEEAALARVRAKREELVELVMRGHRAEGLRPSRAVVEQFVDEHLIPYLARQGLA